MNFIKQVYKQLLLNLLLLFCCFIVVVFLLHALIPISIIISCFYKDCINLQFWTLLSDSWKAIFAHDVIIWHKILFFSTFMMLWAHLSVRTDNRDSDVTEPQKTVKQRLKNGLILLSADIVTLLIITFMLFVISKCILL